MRKRREARRANAGAVQAALARADFNQRGGRDVSLIDRTIICLYVRSVSCLGRAAISERTPSDAAWAWVHLFSGSSARGAPLANDEKCSNFN